MFLWLVFLSSFPLTFISSSLHIHFSFPVLLFILLIHRLILLIRILFMCRWRGFLGDDVTAFIYVLFAWAFCHVLESINRDLNSPCLGVRKYIIRGSNWLLPGINAAAVVKSAVLWKSSALLTSASAISRTEHRQPRGRSVQGSVHGRLIYRCIITSFFPSLLSWGDRICFISSSISIGASLVLANSRHHHYCHRRHHQ